MKKIFIIAMAILAITIPVLAFEPIKLDDMMSINSVHDVNGIKKIEVKTLDVGEFMSKTYNQPVSHEMTYYGLKCSTKEYTWYGDKVYGKNNQLIHEFNMTFLSWEKFENSPHASIFMKAIYDNVCK